MKLKQWWNLQHSSGDETQKLKLWQNSETQIMMKLKNSNDDKTIKKKVTKLKNSNSLKNLIVTEFKLWQNSICDKTQVVDKS